MKFALIFEKEFFRSKAFGKIAKHNFKKLIFSFLPLCSLWQKMSDFLTQKIIGAAIEVHKNLGCGLLESIYEQALCYELELREIKYERQVEIDVIYKGKIIKGQRIDLLVEREAVIEIKSLAKLPEYATAQLLSYLMATGLKRGLIINFGEKRLVDGIKRISH